MKDAKGHGSNKHDVPGKGDLSAMTKAFSAFAGVVNKSGDTDAAHQAAVNAVGQPFRMNSYTHEIVSPKGEVVARMKLGKNNGLAVDQRGVGGIVRSGGPSIHDAVSMPDHLANNAIDKGSFSADKISTALHFLTGNEFAGHTVRRVK